MAPSFVSATTSHRRGHACGATRRSGPSMIVKAGTFMPGRAIIRNPLLVCGWRTARAAFQGVLYVLSFTLSPPACSRRIAAAAACTPANPLSLPCHFVSRGPDRARYLDCPHRCLNRVERALRTPRLVRKSPLLQYCCLHYGSMSQRSCPAPALPARADPRNVFRPRRPGPQR